MISNSDNVAKDSEKKITSQQRSLTPAILGIPSVSHGAKLPPNMNSQEKTELLKRLEAWRQAKKDRLIASVLAKGRQFCNSKTTTNLQRPKIKKTVSEKETNQSNCDGRKTVFERLYENAGKQKMAKPSDENKQEKLNNIKRPQNVKSLPYQNQDKKCKEPRIIENTETRKTVNNLNSSSQEVNLPDSILEDEIKLESGNSRLFESRSQEMWLVKEEMALKQQFPVSANISKGTENLNIKENRNDIMSNDVNTSKKNDSGEKRFEQSKLKYFCESEKKLVSEKAKIFKNGRKNNTDVIGKAPLRRSISLIFRKKTGNYESAIHRTQSEYNLGGLVKDQKKEANIAENFQADSDFNKLKKNGTGACSTKGAKTLSFLTPRYNALSAFHLRNKLENWLAENGHSIDTYRHLRCFGLAAEEVVCTPHHQQQKIDDSDNASFYSTAPNTPVPEIIDESDKENVTPPIPFPRIEKVDQKDVEGWLSDLHRLIVHVKYPGDRCEEWLNAISKKFPNCTRLPIYWECVASMNGNPSGVANEENKCSEVNETDKEAEGPLAELLDKLVLDEKCKSASKIERGLSVKNIFKSKTVKFVLKEKAVKQLDPALGKEARQKVLVATPVRRSARIQTPDKTNIVMSLNSLDPELRKDLSFKPNEALFMG